MRDKLNEIHNLLNSDTLKDCVSKISGEKIIAIKQAEVVSMAGPSLNFVTDGIFHLSGTAYISEKEVPWSLVLKIIKRAEDEKNNPMHHNYWKREALVNQTNILNEFADVFYVPQCYKVEEKENGTIWLWMEEIKQNGKLDWSEEDFAFIARQLGIFNGLYLNNNTVHEEPWICQQWLKSWVDGCTKYAVNPEHFYPHVLDMEIKHLYSDYVNLHKDIHTIFQFLQRLPQVFAHQDLSIQNMFIHDLSHWTLIDWQFLSMSAIGEDLGKLFGVALSQENIPYDQGAYYENLLFTNYLDGLKQTGWNGNAKEARYGFCISFALRSAWEMPKLIKLAAEADKSKEHEIKRLKYITNLQMTLGKEATELYYKNTLQTDV